VRSEVFALIFMEGLLLTGAGLIGGFLLGHGGLVLAVGTIRDATGLVMDPWLLPHTELLALSAMAFCGATASLFPAITCYRRTPINDLHLTE